MALPTILINQVTLGSGTPGVSRADLVVGQNVTLTDPANASGPYLWELIVPVGSSSALTGAFTSSANFTPDIPGTYLVYHTNDSDESWTTNAIGERDTTQGGGAILLPNGTRALGTGETLQFSASRGWTEDFDGIFTDFDKLRRQLSDPRGTLWHGASTSDLSPLAPGLAGYILRSGGAGADLSWLDPSTIQHPLAVPSGAAGFMSGADKEILDALDAQIPRWNVALSGAKNGVNLAYTTPDLFVQDGNVVIRVYLNGQRLSLADDYTVSEGGGIGTGYDTITLMAGMALLSWEQLTADYTVD